MILRWFNSLAGRITLSVTLALIVAQLIAILFFARNAEHEQSQVRTEGVVRSIGNALQLFKDAPGIERRSYASGFNAPGTLFWISSRPVVTQDVRPDATWPALPANWVSLNAPQKRIQWFSDTRPLSMRFTLAPYPTQRNLRAEGRLREGPHAFGPSGFAQGGADGARPPPPSQEGDAEDVSGPPRLAFDPARTVPGPPVDRRPPPRWRMSAELPDGMWLNAELMYEMGLPPWFRTILFQNGLILALTVFLVVPAVMLATRRLSQLAIAADRLGRGEETEKLSESGSAEIKRLTQAFNSMSLRLRRFMQGRTQMLAGITHDLRTPITALRLRTDLVDDVENRDRMQHLIDEMHYLTEGTLALAKDESFTEKSDKVDLSSLIESICEDLTDAGMDAAADVPRGVTLVCRPYSLRRALRNITENGVKYGKRARISMTDAAASVRIIIDDDGPGIPTDKVERAFQPFVRLEESRSRETGGSGLGLAITRSIILNHGGEIAMANRAEGGLRVTVTLPKAVMF